MRLWIGLTAITYSCFVKIGYCVRYSLVDRVLQVKILRTFWC